MSVLRSSQQINTLGYKNYSGLYLVGVILLMAAIIIGFVWYQNKKERDKEVGVCTANEQMKILDEEYHNKGKTPSTDEVVAAYQWALSKCR